MLRKFLGSEIGPAIIAATEAVPADCEIVTFKAGENMPITCCFVKQDETTDGFPEYAWDGERWRHIGDL